MRSISTFSDYNVEKVHGIEEGQQYVMQELENIQSLCEDKELRERIKQLELMQDELFCAVNEEFNK